ncbi:hypothetical protein R1flu_014241 [Riccia fluitans]|uniref:Uncharacterized protein n=1 Tax=Riccia fluitans TaxID=41844 RepID=A0ABD1YFV4_9MARC
MSDSEEEIEMFQRWNQQKQILISVVSMMINRETLFERVSEDNQQFDDLTIRVRNLDVYLQVQPLLFKVVTNFSVEEFEELCALVCPILQQSVQTTGEQNLAISKCSGANRLLSVHLP